MVMDVRKADLFVQQAHDAEERSKAVALAHRDFVRQRIQEEQLKEVTRKTISKGLVACQHGAFLMVAARRAKHRAATRSHREDATTIAQLAAKAAAAAHTEARQAVVQCCVNQAVKAAQQAARTSGRVTKIAVKSVALACISSARDFISEESIKLLSPKMKRRAEIAKLLAFAVASSAATSARLAELSTI
jgi:hypothetical protein